MAYYKVEEWADRDYRLTSAEAVYMELLIGTDKALLLDTGWGLGPLYETVKNITDKPLILVNSHGHVDHVCGNGQFAEPVHIHPKDIELVKTHGSSMMRSWILQTVGQGDFLPEGFDREQYLSRENQNYIPVEEGFVFDLGEKTLEVVELPGHTPGSIGLFYREQNVLLVGDAINGFLLLNLDKVSLETYIFTLEKAKARNASRLIMAHRPDIAGGAVLEKYLEVANKANWDTAEPYVDPNKPDAAPSEKARVVYAEGMTMVDRQDPDFACIVLSRSDPASV